MRLWIAVWPRGHLLWPWPPGAPSGRLPCPSATSPSSSEHPLWLPCCVSCLGPAVGHLSPEPGSPEPRAVVRPTVRARVCSLPLGSHRQPRARTCAHPSSSSLTSVDSRAAVRWHGTAPRFLLTRVRDGKSRPLSAPLVHALLGPPNAAGLEREGRRPALLSSLLHVLPQPRHWSPRGPWRRGHSPTGVKQKLMRLDERRGRGRVSWGPGQRFGGHMLSFCMAAEL